MAFIGSSPIGNAPREAFYDGRNAYMRLESIPAMILTYKDKRTQAFADGRFVREFQAFSRQAYRRLEILDAATSLEELKALRSNRLETLKGDRTGQFSIRINEQWRICFEWARGAVGPSNVEIVDYH
jgi:proteic killer suppression protein